MARSFLRYPIRPLLDVFLRSEWRHQPDASPRTKAILQAHRTWLNLSILDHVKDDVLQSEIVSFYQQVVDLPCHTDSLARRIRFLRYGLTHLLRSSDPMPLRWEACVSSSGTYFIPEFGPSFWKAILAAIDPSLWPDWTSETELGLRRLGLYRDTVSVSLRERLTRFVSGYEYLKTLEPTLTTPQINHFLMRVAHMLNRELLDGTTTPTLLEHLQQTLRQVRSTYPLRKRLKEYREANPDKDYSLEAINEQKHPLIWNDSTIRIWKQLDEACLHPKQQDMSILFEQMVQWLCHKLHIHPLEIADLFTHLDHRGERKSSTPTFAGFCQDTFAFLEELKTHNCKAWMQQHRERYRFVLREPMLELCQELVHRYVEPVLCQQYGWHLVLEPTTGKAITNIQKNDYGQTVPYQTEMWITFYRTLFRNRQEDIQFAVRVDEHGVFFGLHLGRNARVAGKQFRQHIQNEGDRIFQTLEAVGLIEKSQFFTDDPQTILAVDSASSLRRWATEKNLYVGQFLPVSDPLLRCEDLIGSVILLFNRLIPLYILAVEEDPWPKMEQRLGRWTKYPTYTEKQFQQDCHLSRRWLEETKQLLEQKRQIILQGVPGTGKTHVARCLAKYLTRNQPDTVHIVQFHPSYTYEEFVEGIRARTIESDGRHEVTYPVEAGLLCRFADQASQNPQLVYVLIIDEINRGNLPRIFGELLYLLEYREQTLTLPYSRQSFSLPKNLFLIGTMNAADRSVALLDHALRRRFAFIDMAPSQDILASWLQKNHPNSEQSIQEILRLYEQLDNRLTSDLGKPARIGHSYFFLPELDLETVQRVWNHQILPLLEDIFAGQPQRLASYSLDHFLDRKERTRLK